MFRHIFGSRLPVARPHLVPPPRRQRVLAHRSLVYSFLLMLLLSGVIGGWSAASVVFQAQAATHPPTFTLRQFLQQGHPYHAFDGLHVLPDGTHSSSFWNKLSQGTGVKSTPPSAEPPKVKAVSQPVSTSPMHLIGSDAQGQRLEVLLPAGALDVSKATTAKGTVPQQPLTLTLSQLHGHFASATNELGAFQLQITDGQGQLLQGVRLLSPMTLIYHYRLHELTELGLDPGHVYLIWRDLLASAVAARQSFAGDVIPMHNNAAASALTAQTTTLSASPLVLSGTDPIQTPAKPNFAAVQGSGGQLSYSYPLVVPPAPTGTAPSLAVTYSSAATNNRRAPTSPANNAGDGWAVTLGAISATQYPDGTIWYAISGVDNVSDRLIPDTTGTNFATEHISYLQVSKVTSGSTGQPCFDVADTKSNFYEFGCTTDSLQYYIDSSGNRVNYEFDLDKMIPANQGPGTNGRNLIATYVQDQETSGGHTWIRDAALKQINYGNGTNRIGTIDFYYNGPSNYTDPGNGIQYVTQYSSSYETNCHLPAPSPQPQRCDDPIDRSGGLVDPDVMSTLSLQTVKIYTGDDNSASKLDYSYSFSYQESAFGNCPSADTTLSSAYCAGNHLLTSITPTVYQNGTGHALPGVTFGYGAGLPDTYDDSSQSYHLENNWSYLTSYHDHSDGVGASAITYHTAYNNSHGTAYVAGDNRYDTLFCVWNPSYCQSGTQYYPMDDKMWTMQVVTQITEAGKDSSATSLSPATTSYDYWLTKTQGTCPADTATPPNSDCVGFGWIPNSSTDWQDFYHGEFRGFGTVLITSPAGDLTTQYYAATWGWDSPASDPRNYLAGQLLEEDSYQGSYIDGTKLIAKTTSSYGGQNGTHDTCASTTTYPSTTYRPCEVVLLSSRTTTYEQTGSGNSNAPWTQSDNTYDDYTTGSGLGDYHQSPATGSYHNLQQQVLSSSNAPTRTRHWTYYTTNTTSGSFVYYQVHTVAHSDLVDDQSHMWQCQDTTYDQGVGSGVPAPAAGWPTTVTSYSDCSHQSTTAIKTYNGYDNYGDLLATVDGFAAANPSLYTSAGCTLSSAPAFFPTGSWSSSHYIECHKYDPISSLTTDTWNVLSQHTSAVYDATQGQLPTSTTDVNGQVTSMSYSYDGSGNKTVQVKLPNAASSYTSQSTLTSTCTDSSTLPCLEVDANAALYSSAVAKTFYDSLGRAVETLTPGPDTSHTTVTFTTYNDQTHSVFTSLPFVVNSRTTWLDPNGAVDDTGATPGGTAESLDPLGRTSSTTDALSYQSTTAYGLGSVSGDSNTYATTTDVDANKHVQVSYDDALGRTRYTQTYSGLSGGTLTANRKQAVQYNALDQPTSVVVTDLALNTSATTTMTYDDLGRMTSLADPDRGSHTYSYDADGRPYQDVSGARTLGASYDLLGRVGCIQDAAPTTDGSGTCSSGSHPLVQNTYDTTEIGTQGSSDFPVGRLTQSVATTYYSQSDYTNKATVTEQFQHDQRGQLVASTLQLSVPSGWGLTSALPTYKQTQAYNDANQPTTTQTTVGGSAGYTFSQAYDSTTGQLTGLSNNSTGVANLATFGFNAQGQVSDINFQTTSGTALANDHLGYDADLRPQSSTATWQSGSGASGTVFSNSRTYDPVGNVTSLSTTQAAVPGQTGSGGSETQNFCYDEQDRLVWAGNSGTQPAAGNGTCGSASLASGLNGASYNNTFAYTQLGQIAQAPLGGSGAAQQYLYCQSGHPHQLTGVYPTGTTCSNPTGATYSASYDNWGNLTGRTYAGVTATLTYDVLDHLTTWNAGTNNQEWSAYDASGNRVLLRSITGSGTSITTYPFGLEEHRYDATGNNTGSTYYYTLGDRLIGALTGASTLSTQFFLTDALGSVLATFSDTTGSAAVLGNQVYGPYGTQRYTQGAMGTTKGYTGQYADPSGLDYYNARYYDPVVGVFLSADTVQGNAQGMDPYSYVGGNPETKTDPTGQRLISVGDSGATTTGWTNPDGTIYVQHSGQHPTVIGHTHHSSSPWGTSTPTRKTSTSPHKGGKPTKPKCNFVCGGVKDGGLLAKGIASALLGGAITAIAIAGLSNSSWIAGLSTGFFLSWLGQGVSDILYGAREFFNAFRQVSAALLFGLDLAKLVVDVVTAVINAANIVNIIRSPGPGLGFLGKLGYVGKTLVSLFTRTAAPTKTLMSKVAILVSSGYQLASPQLGVMNTIPSDWGNLTSDWNAMSQ